MIRRVVAAGIAAVSLGAALGTTPAWADHTACDNENDDTWVGLVQAGADTGSLPGTLYVCVGMKLVVVRIGGPITYCSYYDWRDPSTADCAYI